VNKLPFPTIQPAGPTFTAQEFTRMQGNIANALKNLTPVAATTSVSPIAAYAVSQNPTGSITNSYSIAKFQTIQKDTNNGYNSGTGLYTVQIPGWYTCICKLSYTIAAAVQNAEVVAAIFQNGITIAATTIGTGLTYPTFLQPLVAVTTFCSANDTIGFYSYSNEGATSYGGTGLFDESYFSIQWMGG